jgi:hypothetical protein
MNKLVALPVAAALPVSSPEIAIEAPTSMDSSAETLRRAEEMVDLLRTRCIREGWQLDELAAERALAYCRGCAASDADPDDERKAALDFFHSHGQSLDWVFLGQNGAMICSLAANSERAAGLADAELIKLADQYIVAKQQYGDLNKLVDKMEGAGKPRGYNKALRAMERAERNYRQLENRIAYLRATTSEGMKAKIRCALTYNKTGEINSIEEGGCPEALAISIFEDVTQLRRPLFLAPATQVDDPIFAAIEAHRTAYAEFLDEPGDQDGALTTADQLANALLAVEPTTINGAAALLEYYAKCMIQDDTYFPDGFFSRKDRAEVPFAAALAKHVSAAMSKIGAKTVLAHA